MRRAFASLALVLTLAVATSSLAGDGALGDVGKNLGKGLEDAKKKADALSAEETKCKQLANKPVPLEDELALGGAVAVKFAESKGVLVDLGGASAAAVKKGAPLPKDSPTNQLVRYLNTVGRLMAAHSSRAQLEWKFMILKDEQVNAWSAPGGYVFVTTGLLRKLKTEDELAGILAHEIAHVSRKHALTHYTAYKNAECSTALKLGAQGADAVMKGAGEVSKSLGPLMKRFSVDLSGAANVDVLKFLTELIIDGIVNRGPGQEAELQADKDAADMMISAHYWVKAYRLFVEKLPASGSHPGGAVRSKSLTDYVTSGRQVDDFNSAPLVATEGRPLGDEMKALASIK